MLVANEDFGSAAAKYEMATGYDKGNPEGYVKYANSYFHVNPKFSIDKLKEFLTLAPQSALAQRELAEKLYEANYWKQAAEQYGQYIQNPNHFPRIRPVMLFFSTTVMTSPIRCRLQKRFSQPLPTTSSWNVSCSLTKPSSNSLIRH